MIALHKERYPYTHVENLILQNFTYFSTANEYLDPVCLLQRHWEVIRYEIAEEAAKVKGA